MEDSFKMYLFAHDLMNFVMAMDRVNLIVPIDDKTRKAMDADSPFNATIGMAVRTLKLNNRVLIQEEFNRLQEYAYDVNVGRWALKRSLNFSSEGYRPSKFLLFASILVGIACIYGQQRREGMVKMLTEVLASILTCYSINGNFIMYGGFEKMTKDSELLLDMVSRGAGEATETTDTEATETDIEASEMSSKGVEATDASATVPEAVGTSISVAESNTTSSAISETTGKPTGARPKIFKKKKGRNHK